MRVCEARMALVQRIAISGLSLLAVLMLWRSTTVFAQGTGPIWDAPFNVSDSPDTSVTPSIACDAFGNIHVFWSEKTQGEPSEFPGRDVADSIFYRQLRDGEWSPAIDVAFADQGESFLRQPTVATDSKGTLYLVWSGYRGVYFSSAPIASATTAAAWSPPALVVPINPIASFSGLVMRPRLVVDETHRSLHVIYSLYGTNGNLFYLRSQDMGLTWDDPVALTDVSLARSSSEVSANGRIFLDQGSGLHAIWDYVVKEGDDWLGKAIQHTVSADNGETWNTPTDVALAWQGARWWGTPDAVATSERLHVVFACGDRPRRCYTYSLDGGETWAQPQRLFGDFQSLAGWDSLTVDMNESVHLITQLRDLQSATHIWHAAMDSGGWPPEPSLTPLEPAMADHFPESCISLGNELHFVMAQEQQGEVWHLSGQLYPEGNTPLALPVPTRAPTPATEISRTAVATVATAATATRMPISSQSPQMQDTAPASRRQASPLVIVLIGTLPALLLVAGVIGFRLNKR